MVHLANSYPPELLADIGFKLYEQFRPEIPKGPEVRGVEGRLYLTRIRDAGLP